MTIKTILMDHKDRIYPAFVGIITIMIKHDRSNKELRQAIKDFEDVQHFLTERMVSKVMHEKVLHHEN